MPTAAHTSGSAAARATAASEVATSVPIVRKRVTPAARARARTSARSASNAGSCRCAWVSKSPVISASTRKRRRPISWPEAVTTSTVQRAAGVGGKSALREKVRNPPGRPPCTGVGSRTVETTRPSWRHRCSIGWRSAAGAATGVNAKSAPQARSSSTLTRPTGSTGSRSRTSRASVGRTRLSGAGGIAGRSAHAARTATAATAAARTAAARQTPARWKCVGRSPRAASAALPTTAAAGGTPTSGSATLSPAKSEKPKKASPSHGRGWTTARYQGSTVVRRAAADRTTKKATVIPSSVVLAK